VCTRSPLEALVIGGCWNDASHLVDVVVTFRRRLDSTAAVGISVHKGLEFAGVDDPLRVAVCLVADDDVRHVRSPRPSAAGAGLVSLRHEHLVLQTMRLVETLATVDAVNDYEQIACNSKPQTISAKVSCSLECTHKCLK